jgi:hypothetical protein
LRVPFNELMSSATPPKMPTCTISCVPGTALTNEGSRNASIAATEHAVANSPGPSPPYHALNMTAA